MEQLLENAPSGQEFTLANGRILKNLYELSNALQSMDDATFEHHVTSDKNDFAAWVEHVFQDAAFAKEIHPLKRQETIAKHIKKRINKFPKKELKDIKKSRVARILPKKETSKEQEVPGQAQAKETSEISHSENQEIIHKLDEVLRREKEIQFREKKIQEIEERLEDELSEAGRQEKKGSTFFSPEFVQGLVAGFLITLICTLVYLRFVMG